MSIRELRVPTSLDLSVVLVMWDIVEMELVVSVRSLSFVYITIVLRKFSATIYDKNNNNISNHNNNNSFFLKIFIVHFFKDINECTLGTDNCDGQATCVNTIGSFSCGCNPGYTGNGVTCVGMKTDRKRIDVFALFKYVFPLPMAIAIQIL